MNETFPWLDRVIRFALEEDLGSGDITTDAIVHPAAIGKAVLVTRHSAVLAGLPVFERVFHFLNTKVVAEAYYRDGDMIEQGQTVCALKGPLGVILKGERTALNFLQRMSGIATLTRRYVEKAGSSRVKVLDTRKTVPGLRWLDKYAVRMGGGSNHRFGLFDGILIKDNHIAAAGSISRAVNLARERTPHTLKVEVEVEDLKGAGEALKAGADVVLLDNMSPEKVREAVRLLKGKVMIEASGGITLEDMDEMAKTGVDFISVGDLTHSVKAADLSLEIVPESVNR